MRVRAIAEIGGAVIVLGVAGGVAASGRSPARAAAAFPVTAAVADGGDSVAVFSGGCFWGMQEVFEHVKGVRSVTSGYAGGSAATATYGQVSTGETGHAESVRITYDPKLISYDQLLRVFFTAAHDPTEINRQGPDRGTQYRSVVWYADSSQEQAAREWIARLDRAKVFPRPVVTEVASLQGFYRAEEYHQGYADQHPDNLYIVINDLPKVRRLRHDLPALYTDARAPAAKQ